MPLTTTWMNLEVIIPSKSDRERQISYDITYIWYLKCDRNELIYKTERLTVTQNKLQLPKGEGRGGINQELVINICTLLYMKEINIKDILYSTGNYIQYLIMTYNGKESEKYEYIYKTE